MRAEGDELAAALGVFDDTLCIFCVGVDAANAAGIEDFQLGREIVLKVRVLDGADMVAADVQKRADVKHDAAHAAIFERLGRSLHHKVRNAGFVSIFKVLVELKHLGRRDVRLLAYFAVVVVDGGENGALRLIFRAQPVI